MFRSTRAAGRGWGQRTTGSTSRQRVPRPGRGKTATSGFTRYEDPTAGAAWLFDGTTFWTFDDPPIMTAKARYAVQKHLGGIMFWELSGDTPDGELVRAIANGMG